jgi:hypothetical protein
MKLKRGVDTMASNKPTGKPAATPVKKNDPVTESKPTQTKPNKKK